MDFVTIHDLSRELNVPARVIRYRLISLIADGRLKEHEDFRRDDFKDEQHFLWKINPLSYMRETTLKPVTPVNQTDNHFVTPDTKSDNNPLPVVDQPNNFKKGSQNSVNHAGNNSSSSVNETAQTENKIATKELTLEREMIDLLKEQLKVKDGQLREQGEQLTDLNDLNVKLTGTMLQQNQKIENMLRLTSGKTDMVKNEFGSADQSEPEKMAA